MSTTEFVIVQTTTDTSEEVENLASALVDQRLAACVQVNTIESYYRWENEVHRDPEYLLNIKTTRDAVDQIKDLLANQHSYDEPEVIVTPIDDGSAGYLRWIRDETTA